MPWLLDRIVDFLHEDDAALKGSINIIDSGLTEAQSLHKDVIKAKYQAIEQEKVDKKDAEKAKVIRKENRRIARDVRAKDLELDKYRDQIERNVIFKGEVVEVTKTNLVEMHGFFGKEMFLGSLGGQIQ